MKKHTKIGLMLLVTVVLLLAMVVPALARKELPEECSLLFPSTNNSVTNNLNLRLPGLYTFFGEIDGKVVNICEGEVPFGEPINPGNTWLEYEDLNGLGRWEWSEEVATFTITEDEDFAVWAWVYDEDGSKYVSTSAYVEVYPEGNYIFYKYYNPNLE